MNRDDTDRELISTQQLRLLFLSQQLSTCSDHLLALILDKQKFTS